MRKFFIFVAVLLTGGTLWAQNPTIAVFPREFTAIDMIGNVKAIITIADSSSTVIELFGLQEKDVKWRVKGGVLSVEVPSGIWDKKGYAEVRISQPVIAKITTTGAEIESATPIRGTSLRIETLGSVNKIVMDVDVERLTVKSSGSSDIALRGRAVNSNLTANIGGRIDCLGVRADSVQASAYGAAEIYVTAEKHLNALATTSATIYYAGQAALQLKSSLFGGIIAINAPGQHPSRLKNEPQDKQAAAVKPAEERVKKRDKDKQSKGAPTSETDSEDSDFF